MGEMVKDPNCAYCVEGELLVICICSKSRAREEE